MNKIYNLIWSRALRCLVVVAECVTNGRGKGGRRVVRAVALGAFGVPVIAFAQGPLPTGGQIVSGTGAIATNGNAMTITQSTGRLITNWNSFSIGAGNSVTFKQPNAASVALNRVIGQDPSQILGTLTSNGQVFLVNPNGIVFGKGAQVRTGAFVASTLGIGDQDFLAGHYRFGNGVGAGGSILNQGVLSGDVVALISPSVVNEGTITGNPGGGVALAAGSDVLLDFDGDGLLSVQVNASTMQTLAENKGLIATDGGTALLTAKGASDALKGVVNNTGTIEAHAIANRGGRILLLADMDHGETQVDGKLDASAAGSGDGGYIETSAHKVSIADSAQVTTKAENGKTGTWLIDPNDFTIAASGGDMTGATLSSQLASSNVEVQSGTTATAGNGDIFVNDVVTWAANKLTLHAARNIVVNSAMNGAGTAGLALEYGQGGVAAGNSATYTVNAPVNLAATGSFATKLGSDGNTVSYTILTSLGSATSNNDGTLQGIGGALSGNYVLGADIDASATSSWNSGAGFTPIGGQSGQFTGAFDGLGHTIGKLTINQPDGNLIGLFGKIGSTATIFNVGLLGISINASSNAGSLAGQSYGTLRNDYATGSVSGFTTVGGLVGAALSGTVGNSYTTATVVGQNTVGGLIGYNRAAVTNAYTTGSVMGGTDGSGLTIGGLIGANDAGAITQSHASGLVLGRNDAGGLVGQNTDGAIANSFATGNVRGQLAADGSVETGTNLGGLVGQNVSNDIHFVTIAHCYATGNVDGGVGTAVPFRSGGQAAGGLVGSNGSVIQDSYSTGSATAYDNVGGLVGYSGLGSIIRSYSTGSVTASDGYAGGLVGYNNSSSIAASYSTGAVAGVFESGSPIGGLVGYNTGSTISNSYATGRVTAGTTVTSATRAGGVSSQIGGLVGLNNGTVESDVYWNTDATGQSNGYGSNGAFGTFLGRGLSTAQMKNPFSFIDAGWDFSSVWGKSQIGNNNGYMVLRSFDSTVYDDYVRLASSNLTRVYGASNPLPSTIALDGAGTANVSVSWGGVIGTHTNVGTYAFSASNVVSVSDSAGRSAYIDYGSGGLIVTPATISGISGIAANRKTYDGTTSATLDSAGAVFQGIVAGDTLSVASAIGAFIDKNAGSGKTVDISGLSLGGASAGNYVLANTTSTTTADIAKATISSITGITADDKTYDGTTAATLNTAGAGFKGMIAGDKLTVATAVGKFSDKNAASGKVVNISGLSLGGADAGNYVIGDTTATTTADIAKATISAITGITANNKTYDGSAAATLSTAGARFSGMAAGDDLNVASAKGGFTDSNPGVGKTVNITGLSLGGIDASNYTLTDTTATTVAAINAPAAPPLTPSQIAKAKSGDLASDNPLTAGSSDLIDVSALAPSSPSSSLADRSPRAAGCVAANVQGGVSSCSR